MTEGAAGKLCLTHTSWSAGLKMAEEAMKSLSEKKPTTA
jgi:hypothetical protein